MHKNEKNDIFTSLLFFTLANLVMGCFLPLIVPTLIVGDSTVGFPAPPARLVVSTSLCIYILVFMFSSEISQCWSGKKESIRQMIKKCSMIEPP